MLKIYLKYFRSSTFFFMKHWSKGFKHYVRTVYQYCEKDSSTKQQDFIVKYVVYISLIEFLDSYEQYTPKGLRKYDFIKLWTGLNLLYISCKTMIVT